jgi:hypothetical protein
VTGHDGIIENAGNAWFQPVPVTLALEELVDEIDICLDTTSATTGEDEDEDGVDDFEVIAEDMQNCRDWLEQTGNRGPIPKSHSLRRASRRFGRDHEASAWIRYLFAAIAVCSD